MRPPRRLVAGGEDTEVGTTRVRHRDGVVRVAAVRSARACGVCTAARGRPAVIPAPAAILQRLRERELAATHKPPSHRRRHRCETSTRVLEGRVGGRPPAFHGAHLTSGKTLPNLLNGCRTDDYRGT